MPATGTNNILTAERWLTILIQKFQDKVEKLGITDTRDFVNSFMGEVIANAGGDISRIELAFNYYGKFPDMGVGKGITLADVGKKGIRKPRRWFNPVFWPQFKCLLHILTKNTAQRGALIVIENIKDVQSRKFKSK